MLCKRERNSRYHGNHKKCMPCHFLRKQSNYPRNSINLKQARAPAPARQRHASSSPANTPDSQSVRPSSAATAVSRSSSDAAARSNMSLLFNPPTFAPQKLRKPDLGDRRRLNPPSRSLFFSTEKRVFGRRLGDYRGNGVRAFFFNPTEERIIKEALKEPVAFMGGMFAGILRLDLNEDPLREWVTRTVEASGISQEELDAEGSKEAEEDAPQQIEIE